MREIFWYGMADEEKIKYLENFSIGIIGSRLLMELLWRGGIGCIRYVGDFVTPNDVRMDASIKPLEANNYDVVHPMSQDTCIISYPYPNDHSELRKQLKGVDIIVAHKYIPEGAKVAEELGSPFMPNVVTTFLPDGTSFFNVEIPPIEFDPISYSLTCSLQAGEIMKMFTGYHLPTIAPVAYTVDVRNEFYLKKLELRTLEK